ncbi:MAG: GNAT family N-acetyltransferase [Clostridiales bacterium]|nr:GNAT family N-acetyltransferase [Clostridiales bacterium]
MYNFEYASINDFTYLRSCDTHIANELLERKIKNKEVIIVENNNRIIGWLRYGYFWDDIPFMNLLMIDEEFRGKGIGKSLVKFWEEEMQKKGHEIVMTSTLSDESAQHFYRKLKYRDSGSLLLEDEALEIVFTKKIIL